MSGTMDRLQLAGTRLREQQVRMRAGRLDRRNEQLRQHVSSLQAELDRERDSRDELVDLLKEEGRVANGRNGAMKLLIVGGAAYILGAKAGRERYDQIVSWARRARAKGEDAVEQLREGDDMKPATAGSPSASLGSTSRSTAGRTTSDV